MSNVLPGKACKTTRWAIIINATVFLNLAAIASFLAALIHIAIIFGGPDWYRFFGAGEQMATLAEAGRWAPTIITAGISLALFLCAFYALSAAGHAPALPLTRFVLMAITAVFLLRGLAGFVLPFISTHPTITEQSVMFWMISSFICTLIGLLFLLGTIKS